VPNNEQISTGDWRGEARSIVVQSWPVLIAQLASMGMMVIDTVLLGHVSAVDLAAVAVGGGIYISVVMALAGVLQSLAPIAAQHLGGGQPARAVAAFWQCLWLALLLAVPGMALLAWPDPLLALSRLDAPVESKTRDVLLILAGGLPAVLAYRTFYAFCNAVGRTRPLIVISLLATAIHAPLAWALVEGRLGGAPLGAAGCALSTVLVSGGGLLAAAGYLRWGAGVAPLAVFAHAARPRLRAFGEFLRLGLPMGFSNFVEISSFTLIALFVAPFGAEVVAGHRIVANLAALAYMLPLSLAIATLARVGQAAGGRDWQRCRRAAGVGIGIAVVASGGLGVVLYAAGGWLAGLYTGDAAVVGIAISLIGYVAFYQLFDAFQTVAGFALRGLKITLAPMLAHVVCFWGVGLGGGAWLAFRGLPGSSAATPMGAAGFWLASVWSTVAAGLIFGVLFRRAMLALDRER
jgi:MATE family, multidrug efflux pump